MSNGTCSCGNGVWLYDPFLHRFSCAKCGKLQGAEDKLNKIQGACYHEWVKYTGMKEQFEFCKFCDTKR